MMSEASSQINSRTFRTSFDAHIHDDQNSVREPYRFDTVSLSCRGPHSDHSPVFDRLPPKSDLVFVDEIHPHRQWYIAVALVRTHPDWLQSSLTEIRLFSVTACHVCNCRSLIFSDSRGCVTVIVHNGIWPCYCMNRAYKCVFSDDADHSLCRSPLVPQGQQTQREIWRWQKRRNCERWLLNPWLCVSFSPQLNRLVLTKTMDRTRLTWSKNRKTRAKRPALIVR